MLILNGHDYYDSVNTYGVDKTVRLMRQKDMKIEMEDCPFTIPFEFNFIFREVGAPNSVFRDRDVNGYTPELITVIVADKKYTGVKMARLFDADSLYFWKPEDLLIWMSDNKITIKEHWHNIKKGQKFNITDLFVKSPLSTEEIKFSIDKGIAIAVNISPIHDRYKVYYHRFNAGNAGERKYVKGVYWQINPIGLKNFQFMKVLDPYTIHQELSMWVGGVLPGSSPIMETISEKVKIEKHGFDPKWSFRKHRDDPKLW